MYQGLQICEGGTIRKVHMYMLLCYLITDQLEPCVHSPPNDCSAKYVQRRNSRSNLAFALPTIINKINKINIYI